MALQRAVFIIAVAVSVRTGASTPFVPACIAEQCFHEAEAIAGDAYSGALVKCASENFGPCAEKAWDCMGDDKCRSAITCAPDVMETCSADIWKMITEPAEREKLTCLLSCMSDGDINPICALKSCGKAAMECLSDETCRGAVLCGPRALKSCSAPAFECLFGGDEVCKQNLQCLGHGISECGSPTLNLMTDTKIADFITCAGSKCSHPVNGLGIKTAKAKSGNVLAKPVLHAIPGSTTQQLLCMAGTCGRDAFTVLKDQDTTNLMQCAAEADLGHLCSSVWECLGDSSCAQTLKCWSQPLGTCAHTIWHALTSGVERARIERTAACVQRCGQNNKDDFMDGMFCVLDQCGEDVLDCWKDEQCKSAVKCMPEVASECALSTLDGYLHQELFKNSVKCVAKGLESCGRAAVGIVQDQNIAKAIRCASQCSRPPAYPPLPTSPTPRTPAPPVPPTPSAQCNVQDAEKQDCGFNGVTQDSCEGKGCCWREASPHSATPWCFHEAPAPSPTPEPTPPPTPAPTQPPTPAPTHPPTPGPPVPTTCDDDTRCPAGTPKCIPASGILKGLRGVLLRFLPLRVKDLVSHVPLFESLVKGTCGSEEHLSLVNI